MEIVETLKLKKQFDELQNEVLASSQEILKLFYNSIQKIANDNEELKLYQLQDNSFKFEIYEFEFNIVLLEGCAIYKQKNIADRFPFLINPLEVVSNNSAKKLLAGSIIVFGGIKSKFNSPYCRFFINKEKEIAYQSFSGYKSVDSFQKIVDIDEFFMRIMKFTIKETMLGIETYWKSEDETRKLDLDDILNRSSIGFKI